LPAGRFTKRPAQYVFDTVGFTNVFEGVTVDVSRTLNGQPGTFVLLDGGAREGTLLLLR
jgi:hypothetical protein